MSRGERKIPVYYYASLDVIKDYKEKDHDNILNDDDNEKLFKVKYKLIKLPNSQLIDLIILYRFV